VRVVTLGRRFIVWSLSALAGGLLSFGPLAAQTSELRGLVLDPDGERELLDELYPAADELGVAFERVSVAPAAGWVTGRHVGLGRVEEVGGDPPDRDAARVAELTDADPRGPQLGALDADRQVGGVRGHGPDPDAVVLRGAPCRYDRQQRDQRHDPAAHLHFQRAWAVPTDDR
jgi:hypothetical protein